MPSYLDAYALCPDRSLATIEAFLDRFVDRAEEEDRGDEQLMFEPLDAPGSFKAPSGRVEWEPTITLAQILERGLHRPRRCFAVYLTPRAGLAVLHVILQFTRDDQVVLGLMVDDASRTGDVAVRWLQLLRTEFGCTRGIVLPDLEPPCSEDEFDEWERDVMCVAAVRWE